MADVFEKLKNSFDKGVATVSVKSNEFVETTKIKTQISNLEKDLENHWKVLGKVVYKQWCENAFDHDSIHEICNEVRAKENEITELQNRLLLMQEESRKILQAQENFTNGIPCACGQINKAGAKFCMGCGTKLEMQADPGEDKILCGCGAVVKKTAKFCPGCGARMAEQESEEKEEEFTEPKESTEEESIVCVCGQVLPATAKFCGACGANL